MTDQLSFYENFVASRLQCRVPGRIKSGQVRAILKPESSIAMPDDFDSPTKNESIDATQSRGIVKKLGLLALLVITVTGGFWLLGDRLSFEYLATKEAALREYHHNFPFWAAVIALAVYVAVAGLSLPGATVLSLACGWYFGFWQGLLIVSFGSTGGATLAFLITRYFLQDWVQQKFAQKLESINKAFEREGAFYLFTLRLIPAVPFVVINAVMGLTKIRAITFWWISQIGMLPGTAAYVYAGSTVPSLQQLAQEGVGKVVSWQLLLAFAILGLLPLVIKRLVAFLRPVHGIESE